MKCDVKTCMNVIDAYLLTALVTAIILMSISLPVITLLYQHYNLNPGRFYLGTVLGFLAFLLWEWGLRMAIMSMLREVKTDGEQGTAEGD